MQNEQNSLKNSNLALAKFINVGVWQPMGKAGQWEFVWFNPQGRAEYLPIFPQENSLNIDSLHAAIAKSYGNLKHNPSLRFISAVLPSQLVQKTVILPAEIPRKAAQERTEMILKSQLPVSLDQVWFDYTLTPLDNGARLDIFAILKEVAQHQVKNFAPLPLQVLESASNVLQYAGRFLAPNVERCLYLYLNGKLGLAVAPQTEQTAILQTETETIDELYAEFCQKFPPTSQGENAIQPIENIIVLNDPTRDHRLPNAQIISSNVPILALGCALWSNA